MKQEICILFLEDIAADVVLISHELRRAHLQFRAKRVDTRDAFLRQLEHHPPDVIISDHAMPDFDGFTALAIARDKCPDVPFIFVTSARGEQFTIQTFESGATDYVLKSNLSNLVPVIQRALREAEERTKARAAEQALRESEERFRMLVAGVKDYAIYMLDKEGRITSWNAGAEWIGGYREEEILGQHFSRFYPPEDVQKRLPETALHTAVAEGRFEATQWRLRKGGARFRAHVVITSLRDESGRHRGFAHVTRNITDTYKAEQALRESEARKAAILATALDAIAYLDHQGAVREWNPAAERIFGINARQAMGQTVDSLILPGALRKLYKEGLAHYLINGAGSLVGRPMELVLRRADGTEFPAEMAITRIQQSDPPPSFAMVFRDITQRKAAEHALRESEEHFRLLIDAVVDYAIYFLDPEGRVTYWNTGGERLLGYTSEEMLGQSFERLYTAEDRAARKPEQVLREAAARGSCEEETWRVRKDGSRFGANSLTTVLRDNAGALRGFARISRDITERQQVQERIIKLNEQLEQRVRERTADLEASNRELEAANKELEAFTYTVSHDLRAPLRHISGFARVLQNLAADKLDEEGRHHLETILDAAGRMNKLIDDLLAFSRMSHAEMHKTRVALDDLVRAARQDLAPELENRKIEWVVGPLPEARGDPRLLRQAIMNLVANAVKYTRARDAARIEVGAEDKDLETVLFVRDNGVGFDMRHAGKLFGVFQRLHRDEEFEGTGIGLANVRRIVERHGGRAWAEATPGVGATFWISLPKETTGRKGQTTKNRG